MKLNKLKDMAGKILKKSKHKLAVNESLYEKNKDFVDKAITRQDVKDIISKGVVKKKVNTGQSKGRSRVLKLKKKLKRKRGPGKRKGTPKSRAKVNYYNIKVRALRKKLKELKEEDKLNDKNYKKLYMMIKGNYFKGKKHLEEYIKGENK